MSEGLMTITNDPFTDLMHFHVRCDVYGKISFMDCDMEVTQQDDYFSFIKLSN